MAFREHLLARGKRPKQVHVAIVRKLLHAIHAALRTDTAFDGRKFYRESRRLRFLRVPQHGSLRPTEYLIRCHRPFDGEPVGPIQRCVDHKYVLHLKITIDMLLDAQKLEGADKINVKGNLQLRPEPKNSEVTFVAATQDFRVTTDYRIAGQSLPGAVKDATEKYVRDFANKCERGITQLIGASFRKQIASLPFYIALSCMDQGFITGVPDGIRTRVGAVKGRCPRPLDDGD